MGLKRQRRRRREKSEGKEEEEMEEKEEKGGIIMREACVCVCVLCGERLMGEWSCAKKAGVDIVIM